jgi:hypothetical protein
MNMNLIHNNHDICVKHNHLRHDINGQYKNYFIYLKAYACVRALSTQQTFLTITNIIIFCL